MHRWSCLECGRGWIGGAGECPTCNTINKHPVNPSILGRLEDPEDDDELEVMDATRRVKLPSRRAGATTKFMLGGFKMYLRTGEYPDGQLGEIFIDCQRQGSAFRSLLSCFGISVSLALQYGVPLDEFVDAFVGTRFPPFGVVQGPHTDWREGDPKPVKFAHSMIDLIFRALAVEYRGRDDLAIDGPEGQAL